MTCVIQGCRRPRDFRGHHVKTRGSGGSDGIWNRLGVCRAHHEEAHTVGMAEFRKRYPEVDAFLRRQEKAELLWQKLKAGTIEEGQMTMEEKDLLKFIRRQQQLNRRAK